MSFMLRGIGGKVSDVMHAMHAMAPKWVGRSGPAKKALEQVEADAMRASDVEAMLTSPGWVAFAAFMRERREVCQHVLESSVVLNQEKALELATIQGRLKEIRSIDEWAEKERERGREATRELAERKRPK